jgi:hypothetical protein
MAVWVTLKTGEVRKYNEGATWSSDYPFTVIRPEGWKAENNLTVAKIRTDGIQCLEFNRPCEITWQPDFTVEHSLDLLLVRAHSIKSQPNLGKLADLSRLLRKFNPQRRTWTR